MKKISIFILIFAFMGNIFLPPAMAQSVVGLPVPGSMVPVSAQYMPALLKGMSLRPDNPLQFDFIVDTGDASKARPDVQQEATKLIKYFMASLTVPDEDLWVNLSPYEGNRIIPRDFGQTEMGRDLLAQDYLLKQLTASLMHPEEDLGKAFWDRVNKKAQELYGTVHIPVNTFNKIWIVPEKAVIFEDQGTAFIVESRLKVMLEEDYVALKASKKDEKFATSRMVDEEMEALSKVTSDVVRDVLCPEIEKEVNTGQNFVHLRQIYHAMILATWFKRTLKESLLGKVYVDRRRTKGIDIEDKEIKQKIYKQYLEAFQTGVFSFIKEEYNPVTQQLIPRKYFSGGFDYDIEQAYERVTTENWGMLTPEAQANYRTQLQQGLEGYGSLLSIGTSFIENADAQGLAAAGGREIEDRAMLGEIADRIEQNWRGDIPGMGENILTQLRNLESNQTAEATTLLMTLRDASTENRSLVQAELDALRAQLAQRPVTFDRAMLSEIADRIKENWTGQWREDVEAYYWERLRNVAPDRMAEAQKILEDMQNNAKDSRDQLLLREEIRSLYFLQRQAADPLEVKKITMQDINRNNAVVTLREMLRDRSVGQLNRDLRESFGLFLNRLPANSEEGRRALQQAAVVVGLDGNLLGEESPELLTGTSRVITISQEAFSTRRLSRLAENLKRVVLVDRDDIAQDKEVEAVSRLLRRNPVRNAMALLREEGYEISEPMSLEEIADGEENVSNARVFDIWTGEELAREKKDETLRADNTLFVEASPTEQASAEAREMDAFFLAIVEPPALTAGEIETLNAQADRLRTFVEETLAQMEGTLNQLESGKISREEAIKEVTGLRGEVPETLKSEEENSLIMAVNQLFYNGYGITKRGTVLGSQYDLIGILDGSIRFLERMSLSDRQAAEEVGTRLVDLTYVIDFLERASISATLSLSRIYDRGSGEIVQVLNPDSVKGTDRAMLAHMEIANKVDVMGITEQQKVAVANTAAAISDMSGQVQTYLSEAKIMEFFDAVDQWIEANPQESLQELSTEGLRARLAPLLSAFESFPQAQDIVRETGSIWQNVLDSHRTKEVVVFSEGGAISDQPLTALLEAWGSSDWLNLPIDFIRNSLNLPTNYITVLQEELTAALGMIKQIETYEMIERIAEVGKGMNAVPNLLSDMQNIRGIDLGQIGAFLETVSQVSEGFKIEEAYRRQYMPLQTVMNAGDQAGAEQRARVLALRGERFGDVDIQPGEVKTLEVEPNKGWGIEISKGTAREILPLTVSGGYLIWGPSRSLVPRDVVQAQTIFRNTPLQADIAGLVTSEAGRARVRLSVRNVGEEPLTVRTIQGQEEGRFAQSDVESLFGAGESVLLSPGAAVQSPAQGADPWLMDVRTPEGVVRLVVQDDRQGGFRYEFQDRRGQVSLVTEAGEGLTGKFNEAFPSEIAIDILDDGFVPWLRIKNLGEAPVRITRVVGEGNTSPGQDGDQAMLVQTQAQETTPQQKKEKVGGIDLDPTLLNLQIKRDPNGIPLPMPQQPIQDMNIDGFYPVILNISPASNLHLLLGENERQPPQLQISQL